MFAMKSLYKWRSKKQRKNQREGNNRETMRRCRRADGGATLKAALRASSKVVEAALRASSKVVEAALRASSKVVEAALRASLKAVEGRYAPR